MQARLAATSATAAAQPLPGVLRRVLPRPAKGALVTNAGEGGWMLKRNTRIVLRMTAPKQVCKVGGLSYLEAAQVLCFVRLDAPAVAKTFRARLPPFRSVVSR